MRGKANRSLSHHSSLPSILDHDEDWQVPSQGCMLVCVCVCVHVCVSMHNREGVFVYIPLSLISESTESECRQSL